MVVGKKAFEVQLVTLKQSQKAWQSTRDTTNLWWDWRQDEGSSPREVTSPEGLLIRYLPLRCWWSNLRSQKDEAIKDRECHTKAQYPEPWYLRYEPREPKVWTTLLEQAKWTKDAWKPPPPKVWASPKVVDMVVENDIQQDNCRELHTELSYLSLLPAVKLV